ncbi:hypothetical protein [Rhizobium leguminosarum]|uniref:hypothetical protein n=1 Tax=Rhizobium leguminosarum TaxID=384 RepID=UPI001FEDEE5C|nr:hypothetical protein [Rhizobium leguminosarum]
MVIDVGEHDAVAGLVDDDPDIAIDPHRPEVRVLRRIDPVELEAWPVRIGLQVERRQFHLLLFVIGELGQGCGKAVGENGGHVRGSFRRRVNGEFLQGLQQPRF